MNKLKSILIFITIIVLNSNLSSNPIAINYVFFNELAFDSSGWKLEIMSELIDDSLSLKGWYIISGEDTAYFQDWMYLSERYLVIAEDSLKGILNINPSGDTLVLMSSIGKIEDYILYGPSTDNNFPPLKMNQSLCNYDFSGKYYVDYSPTIGTCNDTINATGAITGYVMDLKNMPAINKMVRINQIVIPDSGYPFYKLSELRNIYTDSSGHYLCNNIIATKNILFNNKDYKPKYVKQDTIIVLPGQMSYICIHLDWLTDVQNTVFLGKSYTLNQNYPNPFNPVTTISYTIPVKSTTNTKNNITTLKVYDIIGREIATLFNKEQNPGSYKVEFNASHLPSGIYFYKLQAEDYMEVKKMILLK